MTTDRTHTRQRVFRKLVKAHSFPGAMESISCEMNEIDLDLPIPAQIVLLAITLLDAESSFAFFSPDAERYEKCISQLTYAKVVSASMADFVFALGGEEYTSLAVDVAKVGTLSDPHFGATVIINTLDERGASETSWELSGPGIREKKEINIVDNCTWVGLRNKKNQEFPLGIDIILVNSLGGILALPRTTRMRVV